jgi:outer membrane protein OmpA-like peptidoglycan-associated protein
MLIDRFDRLLFRVAALLLGFAMLAASGWAMAQEQPTDQQILNSLKSRGPARGAQQPGANPEPAANSEQANEEKRFIDALLKKKPRSITVDERRRVAEIADEKPSIDLEIPFDFNSAVVGPQAVPILANLGRALTNAELAGTAFLIAGHTDAKGSDGYNQDLSERRAEAVKRYLAENFKLSPDQLLAIGFGKTRLKNPADPLGGENRRVQIVNTEVK